MSDMKSWALHYVDRGLPIIPLNGKIPRVAWSAYKDTAPSREQVEQWWTEYPDSNIGMVTGSYSKILVLDIDGEEGQRSYSGFPRDTTPTTNTRRGAQYYFRYPRQYEGKTTVAGLLRGMDVRGIGGICVLPPSIFSDGSGRYEWINNLDTPLAECPDWLLKLLEEKDRQRVVERDSDSSWLKEKLSGLKEGNRNATFTSIAGSLRSRGYSSTDIFDLLQPHSVNVDFPEDELYTICESVGGYTPRVSVSEEAQSISDFLRDEQKVEWLVPGIVSKGCIGFIAGLQETQKTWMLIDLAVEFARGGGHWLGKFETKSAKVLFVDQERHKSETQRRFKAVITAKDITGKDIQHNLLVASGTTTRINLQQSFDAFRRKLIELKPDIVMIDSFATFHTVAENDRTEIQKVLELIKSLRNEFGCSFLFINHEGKSVLHHEPGEHKEPHSADMMGSIAVPAAAELVLTVRRKDKDSCIVYQTKNTSGPKVEPFEVRVLDIDEAKTKIEVRAS